ncbi:MAG TPA: RNA 2',3'-cyclic phosphodiesterase [Thermoanaerobaculia bacterium]
MRLFIAMKFPSEVLRDLNDRVAAYRSRLPRGSWVKPESQHVTLAFLGDQSESKISIITAELQERLPTIQSFEGHLEGCGFFPNARHAKVGWIGLQPEGRYLEAATVVRGAVAAAGIQLDGSEFKPHLTLIRIRDRWPPASIELFGRALRDFISQPFLNDSVTLYSSHLHPAGAIHEALEEFRLGG